MICKELKKEISKLIKENYSKILKDDDWWIGSTKKFDGFIYGFDLNVYNDGNCRKASVYKIGKDKCFCPTPKYSMLISKKGLK